jgi:DNA-binding beta-propeller fold protein YncE
MTRGIIRAVLLYASATTGAVMAAAGGALAQSSDATLRIEAKILLGEVRGRIDHMAIDLTRQRLLVAELGNNTVGIVDVGQGKLLQVLTGLSEPQGVGVLPSTDTVYVANAGDGSVRLFGGPQYAPSGRIDLGSDADNVRVDPSTQRVVIGYGDGGLAVIDGPSRNKVTDIRLPAHPEGFQLDPGTSRIFVNLPSARSIAVAELSTGKVSAIWRAAGAAANFPMAIDGQSNHLLVVFRNPPKLGVYDKSNGSLVRMVDVCGDADDLFLDTKRQRIYVSCGAGMIDIFDARSHERLFRIPTASGARTSLFVPELDRLFLAVRGSIGSGAAIWVLRPEP